MTAARTVRSDDDVADFALEPNETVAPDSEAWRAFTKENQAASSLFMMTANHTGALDASYAVALLGLGAGEDGRPAPQFAVVAEFDGAVARRTFENRVLRFVRESGENGLTTKSEQYGDATILDPDAADSP